MTQPFKLGLIGSTGKLGSACEQLLLHSNSWPLQLEFSINRSNYSQYKNALLSVDVILEVSRPDFAGTILTDLLALHSQSGSRSALPAVVVGSTGWSSKQNEILHEYEAQGFLLISTNFSPMVTLLNIFLKQNAHVFKHLGYSPSINEIHHVQKIDSPSGTALTFAEPLKNIGLPPKITSVREGAVIGTHVITFTSPDDILELRHEAHSRNLFARGALETATWLAQTRSNNLTGSGRFFMEDTLSANIRRRAE